MKDYKHYRLIITALLSILGIFVMTLAVPQIKKGLALRQSEHIVEARVADWRISSNRGKRYLIRYTFVVDGTQVSHSDATGRKNLWARVSKDMWDKTKTTRKIDVRYDPSDIFNNAPAYKPVSLVDSLAGLGLGILCFVIAALVR